jgi:anti-sigma factor ChrR (cupin superfamily)
MNHSDYIVSLCQILADQGKTPSVALIKSLSNKPLPLTEVLSILQKWKQSGGKLKAATKQAPQEPTVTTEMDRLTALENRVAKLESLLAEVLPAINSRNKGQ